MRMNLSIKNAPEALVEQLKARAKRNHRSLQGELMAIIEDAAAPIAAAAQALREARQDYVAEPRTRHFLTLAQAHEHMRSLGVKSGDDATDIIRRTRDER